MIWRAIDALRAVTMQRKKECRIKKRKAEKTITFVDFARVSEVNKPTRIRKRYFHRLIFRWREENIRFALARKLRTIRNIESWRIVVWFDRASHRCVVAVNEFSIAPKISHTVQNGICNSWIIELFGIVSSFFSMLSQRVWEMFVFFLFATFLFRVRSENWWSLFLLKLISIAAIFFDLYVT